MGMDEIISSRREEIVALAAKHGAFNVRVFGSVAQGTADDKSDVDFLVEVKPGTSLMDLGGLLMDLQELLHRKVDIVTARALHWYIRDRVLEEAKAV